MSRLGINTGKPLHDTAEYVAAIRRRRAGRGPSSRPSIWRRCATRCSTSRSEVAEGAIWANASRAYMPTQVARVRAAGRDGFFLANMIPTVIDDGPRLQHERSIAGR